MLLEYIRPLHIYDVGYSKLLLRGLLVVSLELLLLYIAYHDESPTSFVYFSFGGFIFAGKMRLRANTNYDKETTSLEEREELEIKIRDNQELFRVGVIGRIFYIMFALVMTFIFVCSVFYTRLQNDNDVYPFIQLKPEELKTKYLLLVLGLSWSVVVLDFTCGRSYHWSELMVYEKFYIKYLQTGIEFVLVYLIFTFSKQVKFSIFSLIFFFFVLLTITVFLISLLRENSTNISFGRYISFLKWLTLSGMIVIYSKKSYKKFIELFGKQQTGPTGSTNNSFIKDLVDQFIDKEENFDRILTIFILSTLRQFFADVSNTIDGIRSIIHNKQDIGKDSYFISYFASNILLLMNKRGSDILNYNGSYKLEYFKMLKKVPEIGQIFDNIFSKVKLKLSTTEKYILLAKRLFQTLLSIAVKIFKDHMVIIFQLVLNYLIISNDQYMMLMIMPIIWCMLSFVAFNPGFAVTISIIFLYIPNTLAILQVMASSILCKTNGVIYNWLKLQHYCAFMNKYPILNDTRNVYIVSNETEKDKLFTMLTITIFYVILLIEKKKNQQMITSNLYDKLNLITGSTEKKSEYYEDIKILLKFIVSKIFSNFFYICLIFLFIGIIQTISLFNFLFIVFFFYFILNAQKAKQYWIFLLLYLQFLLVTRYLYSLKFFTFNLDRETSAMIGLYFGTGNPAEERRALISYWLVLIAISVQYQLFYTKLALEFRRVELVFNSALLEKVKLIAIEVLVGLRLVYMTTIIWFFHFFLVLILIYSERTIFNVILMLMEIIFFFYHLRLSKPPITLSSRRKLNKFWQVMVFAILIFSFFFYIFLFCKYTVTKRIIGKFLNIGDDVSLQTDSGSILNKSVRDEFTMIYLVRQKELHIEEKSFIRENLKILLAFVSFFKIMLDRQAIQKESEENAVNEVDKDTLENKKAQALLERKRKREKEGIDSDEEEEEEGDFNMGELEDTLRKETMNMNLNLGEAEDEDEEMLRVTTNKAVKLSFKLTDIIQIFDRLLVYLSHIWKSAILIHITVWTREGPNLFKLIILSTLLITFYRYIRAATNLMGESRLFEIIEKSKFP